MDYVTSDTPTSAAGRPWDLDAIRERAKRATIGSKIHDHLASAADVPALLDALTHAQLDREEYRERLAEAQATIRALAYGGDWTIRKGWMNGDRFQTYTSSAEGFMPPTGPTHQQRIWTGPVEPIEPGA